MGDNGLKCSKCYDFARLEKPSRTLNAVVYSPREDPSKYKRFPPSSSHTLPRTLPRPVLARSSPGPRPALTHPRFKQSTPLFFPNPSETCSKLSKSIAKLFRACFCGASHNCRAIPRTMGGLSHQFGGVLTCLKPSMARYGV